MWISQFVPFSSSGDCSGATNRVNSHKCFKQLRQVGKKIRKCEWVHNVRQLGSNPPACSWTFSASAPADIGPRSTGELGELQYLEPPHSPVLRSSFPKPAHSAIKIQNGSWSFSVLPIHFLVPHCLEYVCVYIYIYISRCAFVIVKECVYST